MPLCTTHLEPRAPRLTADRRGWAQTPAANPGLTAQLSGFRPLPVPQAWGRLCGVGHRRRRGGEPGQGGEVGSTGFPGRRRACTGGRVWAVARFSPGMVRAVCRGVPVTPAARKATVGLEPCGGRVPTRGGPPCGQAALPGENGCALAWTCPAPAPSPGPSPPRGQPPPGVPLGALARRCGEQVSVTSEVAVQPCDLPRRGLHRS